MSMGILQVETLMYLICLVTSHDFLVGGSSLRYITTLISLVTINIVIVEIKYFSFVTWPLVNTCLKDNVNLWVGAPNRALNILPCFVATDVCHKTK